MSGKNSFENPPCGTLILSKTLLFVNKVNYFLKKIYIKTPPNTPTINRNLSRSASIGATCARHIAGMLFICASNASICAFMVAVLHSVGKLCLIASRVFFALSAPSTMGALRAHPPIKPNNKNPIKTLFNVVFP